MIDLVVQKIVAGLLMPIYQFGFSGEARFYWLYALSGMALAYAVHARSGHRSDYARTFMDRRVWLSASARNDYRILFINPVIGLLTASWLFAALHGIGESLSGWFHSAGLTVPLTESGSIAVALALTLALFVTNDFLRWLAHYLMHRVPALWEFHKVHHSAEALNFATARRFHPVDALLSRLITALGAVLVNGLFIGLFGDHLTIITVAGANLLWCCSTWLAASCAIRRSGSASARAWNAGSSLRPCTTFIIPTTLNIMTPTWVARWQSGTACSRPTVRPANRSVRSALVRRRPISGPFRHFIFAPSGLPVGACSAARPAPPPGGAGSTNHGPGIGAWRTTPPVLKSAHDGS